MTPGLHLGVPMLDYLAMPAVSSGGVRRIVDECPAAAWWDSWLNPKRSKEDDSTAENRIGSVAHALLLEGNADLVAIVDAKDWRTNAAKEARAAAIAAGKIPLLPDQVAGVRAMVVAARAFIATLRESEPAIWQIFEPDGGDSEATLVWDARGLPCRARPDRISKDRRLIVDVKTCGSTAEPDAWGRTQLVGNGYYVGAAFYRRGVEVLFDVTPDYVFLVQEQKPPHLCSLVGLDPQGLDLGSSKVRRGTDMWRSCIAANHWPGYANRVCYPEIPPWEIAKWEAGQGGEQAAGVAYDPAVLYSGIFEREAA